MSSRGKQTTDWEIQGNPAFVATTIAWLCEGHASGTSSGLFPPWGMLSLALIAPDAVRSQLPKRANKKLGNLLQEHPLWRGLCSDAVRSWAPAFWSGLRLAVGTGAVRIDHGRLYHVAPLQDARTPFEREVHRASITLGKIIAKEPSDAVLSALFGMRLLP